MENASQRATRRLVISIPCPFEFKIDYAGFLKNFENLENETPNLEKFFGN